MSAVAWLAVGGFGMAAIAMVGVLPPYERFYLASAPRNLSLDPLVARKSRGWAEWPACLAAAGIE